MGKGNTLKVEMSKSLQYIPLNGRIRILIDGYCCGCMRGIYKTDAIRYL